MLFQTENLTVTAYLADGRRKVVAGLSLAADKGEKLAIVGESGCGKTMTALAVAGLLPRNCTATGKVTLDGKELTALSERKLNALRGKEICLIPQSGAEFLNPSLRISTQLYETLKKQGVKRRDRRREACARLRRAGLAEGEDILSRYPFELSGGQAQRVTLAAACSEDVRLLIADEPTKGIDAATAAEFLDELDALFPSAAVIVITHDISVAERADKIAVMLDGEAVECGGASDVLSTPLHPYTRALIAALPKNGLHADRELRPEAAGGCPYFSRCPLAEEVCREHQPLRAVADREVRCCKC